VRKVASNYTLIHVPAILLSAAAEFDQAYGPSGKSEPKLTRISENDRRAKFSSWYQTPIYAQCAGIHGGMLHAKFVQCYHRLIFLFTATPVLIVREPLIQKRPMIYPPITCDRCQVEQKVCRMTSIMSCDACRSSQMPCTIATQPLG